jgi:hypothetical protein
MAFAKGTTDNIGIGTGKTTTPASLGGTLNTALLSSVIDVTTSIGAAIHVYLKSGASTYNLAVTVYILAGTDVTGTDDAQFDDTINALASYQFTQSSGNQEQHFTFPLSQLEGIKALKVKVVSTGTTAATASSVWVTATLATV